MTNTQWAVVDVQNETVVGVWKDYEAANEFFMDNSDNTDLWTVMPSLELIAINH